MSTPPKRVLVIVFDGIEEVEALAPVDIMRRAGIDVTLASAKDGVSITGRNDITFSADSLLSDIDENDFDAVFLPGGPGVLDLVDNAGITSLLQRYANAGKLTTAICAAPKILAVAGLLDSRQATSHASVREDLPHPMDSPVVEDGNIITSQGAGTAISFALALVSRLVGADAATQVAQSIHAPSA